MTGLLVSVLLAAFFVACDTKSPVGPASVTLPTTTTVTVTPTAQGSVTALTASFTVSPTVASVGQQVTVDASGSAAPAGGTIVAYDWNFGNGVLKSGVTTSNNYAAAGAFPIELTVTDNTGQKATAIQTVTVVQAGPTTTTVPPSNAVAHYVATPTVPEVPADLTLLFQLLSSGSSFLFRLSLIRPMADPIYGVSGSWVSANKQITGGVKGQFTGVLTPAVNGQFNGSLTATLPGGCNTERSFTGSLAQALSLAAGTITGPACSPNPWTYGDFSMSQTTAPPPTSTSTTSTSTTSTTSTSTTSTTTSSTTSTTSIPPPPVPPPADLIPFDPQAPPVALPFCRLSGSGLLVQVRNQGLGSAGAFQVQVAFSVSGKPVNVVASLTSLAPSTTSGDLTFAIPTGCFSADCSFTITVDSVNTIAESNESNNVASGRCIG